MIGRGFGIEMEDSYGEEVEKTDFHPSFWNEANSMNFRLNDDIITKSGGSRMNTKARAGVMKPTGSTSADADLQQLTWYFRGFLDNYVHTAGTGTLHIHEYYGGENKELPSFRGIATYDMLKKYIYGMILDQLSLEVSDDSMSVGADWIYKTEKAGIIGSGDSFNRPYALTGEDLFIMFYDVSLKLNDEPLDGVSTAFSFTGNNNHNVDATIGLGSRYPQKRALAGKRDNQLSITTTLTPDTVRSILDAEYGEVGALEPSSCKILQVPLELNIALCEDADQSCKILFPKCTLRVEYDMSNADAIEATMTLETLGTGTATLNDNSTVKTDMYVKLVNKQDIIDGQGGEFVYGEYITVEHEADGVLVTNTDTGEGRTYAISKPFTGASSYDWEAPITVEFDIEDVDGEVRFQLFQAADTYVSQKLTEDLSLSTGGHVKVTYDGTTAKYYVGTSSTPVYQLAKTFTDLFAVRFYLTSEASFKYNNFRIRQE